MSSSWLICTTYMTLFNDYYLRTTPFKKCTSHYWPTLLPWSESVEMYERHIGVHVD
jgi:hypothetical protein